MKCVQPRAAGFTLVEMLIALSLFAIISTAGILLLRASITTQASVTARLADASAIMRLRAMLAAEAMAAQPRITRDSTGNFQPAVIGTADSLMLIHASDGDSASAESRVALSRYRRIGTQLVRDFARRIDGTMPDDATASVVVRNVTALSWRYRAADGSWSPVWAPDRPDRLPLAAELTIVRSGGAPLVMVFQFAPDGLLPPGSTADPS